MLSLTTTLKEKKIEWVALLCEQQSNTSNTILQTVPHLIEERITSSSQAQLSFLSLTTVVENFLTSSQKVFLLLGAAGSGKSFCCHMLIKRLCQETQFSSYIPIYISLSKISNCRESFLERLLEIDYQLLPEHIFWLKQQDNVVFILDGFGEQGPLVNLIVTQQLMHWQGKVIITCRDQYLTECNDHTLYFTPVTHQRQQHRLLTEYRLAPFNETQIFNYVQHSAAKEIQHVIQSDSLLWQLASNPLWLQIIVEELTNNNTEKEKVDPKHSHAVFIKNLITRWFIWQETKYHSLGLLNKKETIQTECWAYCYELANYIRQKDCSTIVYQPVSRLFTKNSDDSLNKLFAPSTLQLTLLRRACPFQEIKPHQYVFMADEFIDYFSDNKSKVEIKEIQSIPVLSKSFSQRSSLVTQPLEQHYLNRKQMTQDVAIMQWLADRVIENKTFEKFLWCLVYSSRKNERMVTAASNAITGLKYAEVNFYHDLSEIQVPHADLSKTNLGSVCLRGANLSKTKLDGSCFWQTDLQNADLREASFGEYPLLKLEDNISSLSYSYDGKYLAVASKKSIRIYNTSTWSIEKTFNKFVNQISKIALSPHGDLLISQERFGAIILWNVKTKQPKQIVENVSECGLSFSNPHTNLLAIGAKNVIGFIKLDSYEFIKAITVESKFLSIRSLAFSPKADRIAVAGARSISVWDVENETCLWKFEGTTFHSISYSADGNRIVSGGEGTDGIKVHVWDVNTGKFIAFKSYEFGWVWSVAFHPDSNLIISGGDDQTIRVWDVEKSICIKTIVYKDLIWQLAFNPTNIGEMAMSSCNNNTVHIRKIDLTENINTSGLSLDSAKVSWDFSFVNLAFQPHGKFLVSIDKTYALKVWEATSGKFQKQLKQYKGWHHVMRVAFSRSGEKLAVIGCSKNREQQAKSDKSSERKGDLHIWDTRTWIRNRVHVTLNQEELANCVGNMSFSPNEKWLAYFCEGCEIDVENLMKKGQVEFSQGYYISLYNTVSEVSSRINFIATKDKHHHDCFHNINFTSDGKWLVYSLKNRIMFHELDDQQFPKPTTDNRIFYVYSHNNINALSFNSKNNLLAICVKGKDKKDDKYLKQEQNEWQENTVFVWNITSVTKLGDTVSSEKIKQDDSSVQTHNTFAMLEKPYKLIGHTKAVTAVAFSPLGDVLASGSSDETVRIWRIKTEEYMEHSFLQKLKCEKEIIIFRGSIESIAWMQNQQGLWLAVGDSTGTIYCFHLSLNCKTILLQWKSRYDSLILNEANINGAYLNESTSNLFRQSGSIGSPIINNLGENKSNSQILDPPIKKGFFNSASTLAKGSNPNFELQRIVKKYSLPEISSTTLEKALRQAATNNQSADLKFLVTQVTDINAQDKTPTSQKTALHWAVIKKHIECAKILLQNGASTEIRDAEGKLPFDYATAELKKLLEDHARNQRRTKIVSKTV
jgi:WD40 repeat protein